MDYKETAGKNTYIDFFSGCGGLSLGLGLASWKGLFAIEKDPMAYSTFHHNLVAENAPYGHFADWPEWLPRKEHAIEDFLADKDILEHLKKLSGKVTLVAGGPPCQGFSVAGSRNGNDPRNLLVFKQIKAIELLKPVYAIVENVEGFERKFVSRPADNITISVAEEAAREIGQLGYNVGKILINAANYGVPQLRKRIIIFAVSKEFAGKLDVVPVMVDLLRKVGLEQREALGLSGEGYATAEEAIGDLSGDDLVAEPEYPQYNTAKYLPPCSEYAKLMRMHMGEIEIPNSHRFNKHSDKIIALYKKAQESQPKGRLSKQFLRDNQCASDKKVVLDPSEPCSTVTTHPDEFIHYKHPRNISLREMARIQSFPDDFYFYGRIYPERAEAWL